jgi:hypothetical protein
LKPTSHFTKPWLLTLTALILATSIVVAGCAQTSPLQKMTPSNIPAGIAYADGQEISFVHTETSDADIAKALTDMMKSPVLYVPALAKAPAEMVANVYVFKNGAAGRGPLGFQSDVFDNPPGTPGYTPLRIITLVTWKDEPKSRILKSAAEVISAEKAGELSLEKTNVVVNMPFNSWQGGKR